MGGKRSQATWRVDKSLARRLKGLRSRGKGAIRTNRERRLGVSCLPAGVDCCCLQEASPRASEPRRQEGPNLLGRLKGWFTRRVCVGDAVGSRALSRDSLSGRPLGCRSAAAAALPGPERRRWPKRWRSTRQSGPRPPRAIADAVRSPIEPPLLALMTTGEFRSRSCGRPTTNSFLDQQQRPSSSSSPRQATPCPSPTARHAKHALS